MPVTLKDIAERTGVSPSVVSTVLSGRDNGTFVSDSTRRKVLQVAESLNYTPVRAGRPRGSRRLRRQHTEQFIGVWDPDYSPYSAYMVQNLQVALRDHAKAAGSGSGRRLRPAPADSGRSAAPGCARHHGYCSAFVLASAPRGGSSQHSLRHGRRDGQPAPRVEPRVHLDNLAAGRLLGDYLMGVWAIDRMRFSRPPQRGAGDAAASSRLAIRLAWGRGDRPKLVDASAV